MSHKGTVGFPGIQGAEGGRLGKLETANSYIISDFYSYWEGRGVSMGVSGADLVGLGSF